MRTHPRTLSFVLLSVLAISGCGVDPCDGKIGTCLTLEVQGDVTLDEIRGELRGAINGHFSNPGRSVKPPFLHAVSDIGDGTGDLTISAATYLDGALTGVGYTTIAITPGLHARVRFPLRSASAPSCEDHVLDGDERGVDCLGSCPKVCTLGDTCRMGKDMDGGTYRDCSQEYPCFGGVCSSCAVTGTCGAGFLRCVMGKCVP